MSIEGLHKCQPENTPHVGDVKNFTLEQIPARDGKKAWLKIKGDNEHGSLYEVMTVKQAFGGKADSHGNLAFNLDLEPANGTQSRQDARTQSFHPNPGSSAQQDVNAPQRVPDHSGNIAGTPQWIPAGIPKSGNLSREDYWTIKDERDREREARFVANQPRIERRHSQHMMMLYFSMRPQLLEACTDAKQAQTLMREVTDHFQKDIGRSPHKEPEARVIPLGTPEDFGHNELPEEPPF